MLFRALLPLALVLPAPAFAETIFDTHTVVPMPAGKTVKLFRPNAKPNCAVAPRHHQSGKMLLTPATGAEASCAKLAKADTPRPIDAAVR